MHHQLQPIAKILSKMELELIIRQKAVKNINISVKSRQVYVSFPNHISPDLIANILQSKMEWLIKKSQSTRNNDAPNKIPTLWGERLDVEDWHLKNGKNWRKNKQKQWVASSLDEKILWIYRDELTAWVQCVQEKWQAVVGKSASRIRYRDMRTRWGSCNVRTASLTMNIKLAAFLRPCAEYVLVHELCHLHHANHSRAFWRVVERAMPDYQHWHQMLKNQGQINQVNGKLMS